MQTPKSIFGFMRKMSMLNNFCTFMFVFDRIDRKRDILEKLITDVITFLETYP